MAIDHGPVSRVVGPTIFASGWHELRELVLRHDRSPAVVDLGFESATDPPGANSIQALQGMSVPLVGYGNRNGEEDVEPLDVCFVGSWRPTASDSVGAIASAVLRAADMHTVNCFLAAIAERTHAEIKHIFLAVLAVAVRRSTVRDLAAALARSERSLRRHCAALRLPPPKKLLSLGRIFTVERLAEWSGQPSGAVAMALGFSDYANYRRLVRNTLADASPAVPGRVGAEYVRRVILQCLERRQFLPVR